LFNLSSTKSSINLKKTLPLVRDAREAHVVPTLAGVEVGDNVVADTTLLADTEMAPGPHIITIDIIPTRKPRT
jgi:hypothetical protein